MIKYRKIASDFEERVTNIDTNKERIVNAWLHRICHHYFVCYNSIVKRVINVISDSNGYELNKANSYKYDYYLNPSFYTLYPIEQLLSQSLNYIFLLQFSIIWKLFLSYGRKAATINKISISLILSIYFLIICSLFVSLIFEKANKIGC